jgi:drug/metabolite transporter (DMT)-like permease
MAAETPNPKKQYLLGALFGLAAVSIWAGWFVLTRLGVETSLSIYDVTMLRFGTAGLLLLPVVLRRGLALRQLGWWRLLILIFGAGAPYTLVAAGGLRFASAAHAGAIIPGTMSLLVALFATLFLKEKIPTARRIGYGLILAGVAGVVEMAAPLAGASYGHLLFLTAALLWASYTVVLRYGRLEPLHAAAIVAVGSGVLFLPFYLAVHGLHPIAAPIRDIIFQAVFQGIVATILALFCFGKAVSLLGAAAGAAFGALVPVMAAILAIPLLGEVPPAQDWAAILAISAGVYLTARPPRSETAAKIAAMAK